MMEKNVNPQFCLFFLLSHPRLSSITSNKLNMYESPIARRFGFFFIIFPFFTRI